MIKRTWLRTWWWTFAFCGIIGLAYSQGIQKMDATLRAVTLSLDAIEQQTILAMEEQETLTLRLDSQSDPAWIELVLLRQMGVVPDGFLKVHFKR